MVQDTLDACTLENLAQMEAAMNAIYPLTNALARAIATTTRQSSQCWMWIAEFPVLDVDLSGKPCGRKAELATKGYFGLFRAISAARATGAAISHQVGRVLDLTRVGILVRMQEKQGMTGSEQSEAL